MHSSLCPTGASRRALQLALLALLLVLVAIPLTRTGLDMLSPTEVQPGRDPQHADSRHGGERHPPAAIRACILAMAVPFEYHNGAQVAFLCRLARNRWGLQIVDAASHREITTFYTTLARAKNILARDGYTPLVPLP